MSNHQWMERMVQQMQQERLRKAQPLWELDRSRSKARHTGAMVWLKRLGTFFRVWIPKRQQGF